MRIGIRTVFKTDNCGSFLQAWALKEHLTSLGNDVHFCDYKTAFGTRKNRIIGVVKCCLRLRFKRAKSIINRHSQFQKERESLSVMDPSKCNADIYLFGSDTLWNFDDATFREYSPFFTGSGIEKPCFAYSISVGSTEKERFSKNKEAIENIKRFRKISTRDSHSTGVLSEFYPAESIVQTIDPTLLLNKDEYTKKFAIKPLCDQKSIVIYYFGDISDELWAQIKAFAHKNNLKIINVGLYEDRFDISEAPFPQNFITAFANAEYIFTNTFHGCVFSVIFEKRFATNGIDKKKIKGFLEEFSLIDRAVSSPDEIEGVLNTPIDYGRTNALIAESRMRSIKYLESVICTENDYE